MAVEYRISKLGGGIAVFLALSIDLLQLGLDFIGIGGVINPFMITPITYLSFWTWFVLKGIKFGSRKNATTVLIGSIIEMIPYVDLLPGITVMTARIILNSRVEDLANSGTLAGRVASKGVKAVNQNAGQITPTQKTGGKQQPTFNQNQPTRPPTNLNNIQTPAKLAPTNTAKIINIEPNRPINLAQKPDQYREAA